jgi:hypothetical protein
LLAFGAKRFEGDFSHGGTEPIYPLPEEMPAKVEWGKMRVDCEVLRTKHAGVAAKWYFALEDDKSKRWQKGQLIGAEVTRDRDEDPCEIYFSEYTDVGGGRKLPSKFAVRKGEGRYATLTLTKATLK